MNPFERHHESSFHPKFPLISRLSCLVSLSSPKCNHWETDSNGKNSCLMAHQRQKSVRHTSWSFSSKKGEALEGDSRMRACVGQVTSSDPVNCSLITIVLGQHTTHQITKKRTWTSRKPAASLRYILSAGGRSSEQPQTLRRMVQGFNSWLGTFPGAHFSPCPNPFDDRLTVNRLF